MQILRLGLAGAQVAVASGVLCRGLYRHQELFQCIQLSDTGVNNTFYSTHTNTQKSMTSGGAYCF